ncbi:hypothetical protein D3C84_763320 [compost metagenome]
MNDRELLELAAKAAGIHGVLVERPAIDGYPTDFVGIGRSAATIAPLWNPLADDGDALRLAVKLGARVYVYPGHGDDCTIVATDDAARYKGWAREPHNGDPEKATRRAIVRAAAEIGRAMP